MRRCIYMIMGALCAICAWAQDEQDAARLMNPDILGSSRYTSMGGAFVALGGDITAVKDNPAGLGVFRKTDASVSLFVPTSVSDVSWNGVQQRRDNRTTCQGGHIGLALNFDGNRTSGLVSHTFGFNYQRVKSFNRTLYMTARNQGTSITDLYAQTANSDCYSTPSTLLASNAYSNTEQAWPSVLSHDAYLINYDTASQSFASLLQEGETVSSKYYMREQGYLDEYDFGWGCNISDIVYLGASLNVMSLHYRLDNSYVENFGEGGGMTAENVLQQNGTGFSGNFGIIVTPLDWLRLGASIRTATAWKMTDDNSGDICSTTAYTNNQYYATPSGSVDYRLRQPFRVNAGVAFVIGDWALISGEYEYDRFSRARYKVSGDPDAYEDANSMMPYAMKDVSTFKLGAEVRPLDWLSLRVGYDYMTSLTPKDYNHEVRYNTMRTDSEWSRFKGAQYASAGIGFRGDWWYVDLSYQYRCMKEDYYPYSTAAYGYDGRTYTVNTTSASLSPAESKAKRHVVSATFGVRF